MTPNFSVLPKEEIESSLSQILRAEVPVKYYLSAKTCQGILRRARQRGKVLPLPLKDALFAQAGLAETGKVTACDENICLNDQGGERMDLSYGVAGTLRARMDNHAPVIMNVQGTYTAKQRKEPPTLFENHSQSARYRGPLEVAPAISAAYGEGGNNTALCLDGEGRRVY